MISFPMVVFLSLSLAVSLFLSLGRVLVYWSSMLKGVALHIDSTTCSELTTSMYLVQLVKFGGLNTIYLLEAGGMKHLKL